MHRKHLGVYICAFALLVIAGCIRQLPTELTSQADEYCASITLDGVREIVREPGLEESRVIEWIDATYGIPTTSVTLSNESLPKYSETIRLFDWETPAARYRVEAVDGHVVALHMGWKSQSPAIAAITHCLGDPNSYIAHVGLGNADQGHVLFLILFYPEQGLLIRSGRSWSSPTAPSEGGDLPADFVLETTASGIRVSRSKSVAALIDEYLTVGLALDFRRKSHTAIRDWYRDQVRPWPENDSTLQYTTEPYP